jgi:hypothetical protein
VAQREEVLLEQVVWLQVPRWEEVKPSLELESQDLGEVEQMQVCLLSWVELLLQQL